MRRILIATLIATACGPQRSPAPQVDDQESVAAPAQAPAIEDPTVEPEVAPTNEPPPTVETEPPPVVTPVPEPTHATRYPVGATHSPLSPVVATHLRAVVAKGSMLPRFSKVGDSITVAPSFLNCFEGNAINYGTQPELSSTAEYFTGSFSRTSLSAKGGWAAFNVLGASRLKNEIDAFAAQFAVVMLGTNDSAYDPVAYDFFKYASDMFTIIDTLANAGIVPILSSIPPRTKNATVIARIPTYNAFLRGLAEARQIPFVDYNLEMQKLPGLGISSDSVHPNVLSGLPCDLTALYGYNLRNKLTLMALDRVKRVVVDGETPPDAAGSARKGTGTEADPIVIDGFPFTDLRDTKTASSDVFDSYPACGAQQIESGPEVIYSLTLNETRTISAYVFDPGVTDVDLHLLDSTGCVQRHDRFIARTLPPGTHRFVLDTYVSGGIERSGEYLFLLVAE